jgi:hypothetical protein
MVYAFSVQLICWQLPGFKVWGLAPGWVVHFLSEKQLAALRHFFLQKKHHPPRADHSRV